MEMPFKDLSETYVLRPNAGPGFTWTVKDNRHGDRLCRGTGRKRLSYAVAGRTPDSVLKGYRRPVTSASSQAVTMNFKMLT
jgi:hypothetical protein